MNFPCALWAIHGFLGQTSDWNTLRMEQLQAVEIDSFSSSNMVTWAHQFNAYIESQASLPSVLMGYSLGGRLALHALCQKPSLWQAAIIVSAHPGLTQLDLKEERLKNDAIWAKRFEEEPWEQLMASWNHQAVFAQDGCPPDRQEKYYERLQLAKQLLSFSLGHQEDLRENIAALSMPVLWMVGEKDQKFCEAAKTVKLAHPLSKYLMIEQAGHRLMWARPLQFKQSVEQFLNSLNPERGRIKESQ